MEPVVSSSHTLTLWPTEQVTSFAAADGNALMTTIGNPIQIEIVPGSLHVNDTPDGNVYNKVLQFRVRRPSADRTRDLSALRMGEYVALYTDERGDRRACGSLNYPLTFTVSYQDGLYQCELHGNGEEADLYM